MGYKREIQPRMLPTGEDLTRALVGIGMLFTGAAASDPNLEDTLLAASVEGLEREDLRVLAVLVTWLEIHHPWLNADRLVDLAGACPGDRVKAFWCAMGRFLAKDRRLGKLAWLYQGPRLDLLGTGTEFHLRRSGEDPRFQGGLCGCRPVFCATGRRMCSNRPNWRGGIAGIAGGCSWVQATGPTSGRNWTASRIPHPRNGPGVLTPPSPPPGR